MDSRPGPVRHCRSCRSCVSYVYVFSKKITCRDVVYCTGKRTSRKLAEKEVFVGISRCLVSLLCSARGSHVDGV